MSNIVAVVFLGTAAAMVVFILVLGFLERRNPSEPTVGPLGSRDVDKA